MFGESQGRFGVIIGKQYHLCIFLWVKIKIKFFTVLSLNCVYDLGNMLSVYIIIIMLLYLQKNKKYGQVVNMMITAIMSSALSQHVNLSGGMVIMSRHENKNITLAGAMACRYTNCIGNHLLAISVSIRCHNKSRNQVVLSIIDNSNILLCLQ